MRWRPPRASFNWPRAGAAADWRSSARGNCPAHARRARQKIPPPLVGPISMRPHFDGFVIDQ
ncbi:MAG: Mandelate racemase/muconate lactonizing enzyme-like protein [uncultured Caballeronia sp.]|nr:MAG: Mandelate racemase/muconate lactonizing enzyme-like protein [uncultured Caballeronia sp.]